MAERMLFGLLGRGLSHSFSPLIFNHYFEKLGIDSLYLPFSVSPEALPRFLEDIRNSSLVGFNVTIPHKERIIPYLSQLDEEASKIGSINAVHNLDGRFKGYNTDHIGFTRALEKYDTSKISCAVILGAGGAAKAVIYSLYKLGIKEIIFFSRSEKRIEEVLSNFSLISNLKGALWNAERIKEEAKRADLLVNATPLGMKPFEKDSPLEIDFSLKESFIVFDLIYNPRITRFLKSAKEKGAIIENGLAMLLYQALKSLKIWLGEGIDEDFFIKTCEEVLNASLSDCW